LEAAVMRREGHLTGAVKDGPPSTLVKAHGLIVRITQVTGAKSLGWLNKEFRDPGVGLLDK
jgi:hypothetical protein